MDIESLDLNIADANCDGVIDIFDVSKILRTLQMITEYEAMQMMREIETAVRREKDTAVAAQAAGDDALRKDCQRNINALVRRYAEIAKASGNAEKRQRMTVEGFRAVKVLDKPKKSDIMGVTTNAAGKQVLIVRGSELHGKPSSITQVVHKKGGIDRNFYDENGDQFLQISNNGHGHKKEEALGLHGEHAHDYSYNADGVLKRGDARELTDLEREENGDML